jgi:N-acetylmuramoyl-L-alanine amidase
MMKKTTTLLLLCGLASCSFASSHPIGPRQKAALRTIVIDPGHGGFDHGCHGLFAKEKDVCLDIALKLGKAIEQNFPEIKVVYTRTTDIMPGNEPTVKTGLYYRAELANKAKGDLFICIHANSNGHPAGTYQAKRVIGHKMIGRGRRRKKVPVYESYTVKNTTTGTLSFIWKAMWGEKKGDVINDMTEEDMGDSSTSPLDLSSPEARIRAQLYEKKYFANSAFFATLVQNEFVKAGRRSEGVQQRETGIWVLEATGMPSVLIETGYLTNKEEEEYLSSEEGQGEVVQNIIAALKRYKNSLDGHADTGAVRANPRMSARIAR